MSNTIFLWDPSGAPYSRCSMLPGQGAKSSICFFVPAHRACNALILVFCLTMNWFVVVIVSVLLNNELCCCYCFRFFKDTSQLGILLLHHKGSSLGRPRPCLTGDANCAHGMHGKLMSITSDLIRKPRLLPWRWRKSTGTFCFKFFNS